ncbi:hypothetical protein SERLA73DRAFT_125973 [Serpula lacrymans var. lacrymans S7.3]|uniref:Uncharacterized protein n=1 Tax=Serpula lacrymans var. lacrymans (strain S7.3) TaxID=936435 RepID=F8QB95_SERL3|nr:hypothetical protein SERLA73DRAFT_125973 [Serpula lacrymans var. lacrymans S7.3]
MYTQSRGVCKIDISWDHDVAILLFISTKWKFLGGTCFDVVTSRQGLRKPSSCHTGLFVLIHT